MKSPGFTALLTVTGLAALVLSPALLKGQVLSFAGAGPVDFGNINICTPGQTTPAPCGATRTLTFNVTESGTIIDARVFTNGTDYASVSRFDYTQSGASSCVGQVTAGTTCTIVVNYAPTLPGLREGAVLFQASDYTVTGKVLLRGQATGPEIAFDTGAAIFLSSIRPFGIASNNFGNIYAVIDSAFQGSAGAVEIQGWSYTPTGYNYGYTDVAIGLNRPTGIAISGAGDVYLAVSGDNDVMKFPWGVEPITIVASGLNDPQGVAVDGSGNVFIADTGNNRVLEVPASGGPDTTLGNGLSKPNAVAVDGGGNLFIADTGNGRVLEIAAAGGSQTQVGTGFSAPSQLAVDAQGNLFVADASNNQIFIVPPQGGAQTAFSFPGQQGSAIGGMAISATGDIYISLPDLEELAILQKSQVPMLNFAATDVGASSSDSPQVIGIQNVGNAPLNGTGLSVSANFQQVPGSGTPEDCSSSFSLAPGAECNLNLSFVPEYAVELHGEAVLTDNSLNATAATQIIKMNGVGIVTPTSAAVTASPNPQMLGSPVTFAATLTPLAGSGPVVGVVYFHVNDGPGILGNLDDTGHASFTTSALPVGQNKVTIDYPGFGDEYAASTANTIVTIVGGKVATPFFPRLGATYYLPVSVEILTATPGAAIYYTTDGTPPTIASMRYIGPFTVASTTTVNAIAAMAGDSSSAVASATFTIVPSASLTEIDLQSSANPSIQGQTTTFTANVTAASGSTPTGSVTFKNNGVVLSTAPLVNGTAVFTTSSLTSGSHSVAAVYLGDAVDTSSTAVITQQVN